MPTCLRNHALLEEVKAGRGPIRMVTKEAFQDPHKETVGWENFLGMTIGQVVWASQNIDPKEINPELTTSEPYPMVWPSAKPYFNAFSKFAFGKPLPKPPIVEPALRVSVRLLAWPSRAMPAGVTAASRRSPNAAPHPDAARAARPACRKRREGFL